MCTGQKVFQGLIPTPPTQLSALIPFFGEIRKGSLLTVMQDTRRWTTDTLAKRKDLLPATLQPESPVPSVEKHIREQVADASLWEVTQVSKKGLWELRQSLASKTVRLIDGCSDM